MKKFINIYLWGLRNLHTHGFLPKVVHQLEEAFFLSKNASGILSDFFFWEWWFMRAQLSCNFSKIKMDWSCHYQVNNEAILVKQKKIIRHVMKSNNARKWKNLKTRRKRAQNQPQPTLLTQQIKVKKREKNHRVSVYCLSFEKTWFFCIIVISQLF